MLSDTPSICLLFILLLSLGCQDQKSASIYKTEVHHSKTDSIIFSPRQIEEHDLMSFDYDTTVWTEIVEQPHIRLDLKYATTANFTKQKIYPCGRCFLRKQTGNQFLRLVQNVKKLNFGFILYDCYRPHDAQKKLWEIVPNPMYVADPKKGSMHNRGLAIDLGLTDENGTILNMGTEFDYFGKRAYHDYLDLPDSILARRTTLKELMKSHGFKHTRTEWWHYSDSQHWAEVDSFNWKCVE